MKQNDEHQDEVQKNVFGVSHPFKCYAPFSNLVLSPDYFSGTRLQSDICMLELSFSTYYDLAKLQLVGGE